MKKLDGLKQAAFEKKSFDGFLITKEADMLYFAGFSEAECLFIPKSGVSTIYVYPLNYEQAKAEVKEFKIELIKRNENLMAKIAKSAKALQIKKLAFDTLNLENYRSLTKELRGKTRLKAQNDLVLGLRKVKDEEEIELMRKAGELTIAGMRTAYELIKPGIKEYEVAAELEYVMRRKGSYGTAFETIVASGVRSAFPHGRSTDRQIKEGDLVVIDIGAAYYYYRSDMTRTLVAGEPSEKQKKLYEIVKAAQEKAFQAIKPKVKAKEVDAIARKVIEDAGYGEHFVHGLGHGIGLEVHEPPSLGRRSKDRLAIGNVVTIEPGIYIVGFGGIRIEDTILVAEREAEKFTKGLYTLEAEQ